MIGRHLAHYEILAQLGQGGMGEVWLARDTRLAREVAIKLMPAELANDPQRRARFEREAQAVAALNHPNVVTIHAVEEAEGLLFLVMERVHGVTLTRKIPGHGLPLKDFFSLGIPLCEAVAAAHAVGITHRDLKPENVMVDDAGRLKVLDFGLAKVVEEDRSNDETIAVQTREGVILGTAAYMSPEQAEGKPVGLRSDVFTLGILLYEMLTGTRPFSGDTHMSTLTAVIRDEPKPVVEIRPELPLQFQRIVRRCLEKDPERRYESARSIAYDLEALRDELLSGVAEGAGPVDTVAAGGGATSIDPMLSRTNPPSMSIPPEAGSGNTGRRNGAIGLILALVVLGVVWWQWPAGQPPVQVQETVEQAEQPLVVVFPFENLGPAEDEYFAAGITTEITARLSNVPSLRVLSRSSAVQYDRAGKTPQQIAADLGVDYVLEGSIRWQKASDGASRVRVTPQLVGTEAGVQIWAGSFDRAMDEIFAVQSEIADAVVGKLGLALGESATQVAESAPPTDNIDAYHYYLRGSTMLSDVSDQSEDMLDRCIRLLESAVELDPAFAAAWGQLARAHAAVVHFGWDPSDERIESSRAASERGIALDPDNAVVQRGRGFYFYHARKDYEPALAAFQRSLELAPGDVQTMSATGYALRRQGRMHEALEWIRRAYELSPQDPNTSYDLAETLQLLRRYDEATVAASDAIRREPDSPILAELLLSIELCDGDLRAARSFDDKYLGENDTFLRCRQFELAMAERDGERALAIANEIPEVERMQFVIPSRGLFRAEALTFLGSPEAAATAAEEALVALGRLDAETPGNANITSAMALARSYISEEEAGEAVALARTALGQFPANRDVWLRTARQQDLAEVLIRAGRHEEAVALLAELLEMDTTEISVGKLRLMPVYDALRERPDFLELVD